MSCASSHVHSHNTHTCNIQLIHKLAKCFYTSRYQLTRFIVHRTQLLSDWSCDHERFAFVLNAHHSEAMNVVRCQVFRAKLFSQPWIWSEPVLATRTWIRGMSQTETESKSVEYAGRRHPQTTISCVYQCAYWLQMIFNYAWLMMMMNM